MSTLHAQSLADQLAEFRLRHDCGIPVDLDALLVAAADFADTFESTIEGLNREIAEAEDESQEAECRKDEAQERADELERQLDRANEDNKRLESLVSKLQEKVSA